jgi:hypothetical protein
MHAKTFIQGIIVGIIVGQIGFSGIAKILDKGVSAIQYYANQYSKSQTTP